MTRIACLFISVPSCYDSVPNTSRWPIGRDARGYCGPYPVVAHPPCARWSRLAHVHESKWGKGKYIGNDGGCFAFALECVRRYGGVLEHPAMTMAWARYGLRQPTSHEWTLGDWHGGMVAQVEQWHYGHAANKPTWLYAVGCDLPKLKHGKSKSMLKDFSKELSKWERSATPPAFRDLLVSMARSVKPKT